MDIVNEILARKRLVPDKAKEYGFARAENGEMTYSSPLMDGELTCRITVSEGSQVKCIVADTDTGDEYTPVKIDSYTGSYVGSVREELRALITEIADKCFCDIPAAAYSRHKDGTRAYWIIPSNPANYDVAKGFRDSGNDIIPWHHRINVLPGDIVYIYQTEPVAAIIYRCEVVDSFLPRPKSWSGMAPSSKYRMDIHRTDTYDKSKYPRSFLNEHGIKKTVRGQRSAPPELVKIIERQVKI